MHTDIIHQLQNMSEIKMTYFKDISHVTYHLSVKFEIYTKQELLYSRTIWTKLNLPENLAEKLSIINVLKLADQFTTQKIIMHRLTWTPHPAFALCNEFIKFKCADILHTVAMTLFFYFLTLMSHEMWGVLEYRSFNERSPCCKCYKYETLQMFLWHLY
jgi:hypothetical protein